MKACNGIWIFAVLVDVKHAGFGLGFDRMLMYLSGMQNIRDVEPFPRTPKNLVF
mgnify:CR=1 FL=1